MYIDSTIFRTREAPDPQDKDRTLWYGYAKHRRDWYLIIVQDSISGYQYPVFVPEFDSLNLHFATHHRQNDQWIVAIYETWGD
jgi:hypothetical protein